MKTDLEKLEMFVSGMGRIAAMAKKGIDGVKGIKLRHDLGRCTSVNCEHPEVPVEPGAPLGLCGDCFEIQFARLARVVRTAGIK